MPSSDAHFSEFKPHSQHKHCILEYYIQGWGRKLLLRPGAGDRVRLIDACAGRGRDEVGNPGSPLITARVAAQVTAQLQESRRSVQVDVIAIEKKPSYFRELRSLLAPFGPSVRVLKGTLSEHLDILDAEGGGQPTFYFIDPFGIEPLQATTIKRALAPPSTEAFLLFASQSALRHFGAIQTIETNAVRKLRQHDQALSLFEEWHKEKRDELESRAKVSQGALEITRERAVEILDAAFGGHDWFAAIEGTPPDQRRNKFLDLYREVLRDSGARFILSVPMLDADGTHVYFLVHATRSPAGHILMKEAVEHALGRSPLPVDVVESLRDLLRVDPKQVLHFLERRHAGSEVRWTPDRDDKAAPSLKIEVLSETEMYPFQIKDLKGLLKPYKRPGRTLVYRFPPI